MSTVLHPEDAVLMAIAAGEPVEGAMSSHVAGCPVCRAEVQAFGAVRALRALAPTPFETARAERDLLRAIDGDLVERRRAWRPAAVAAAVILAASTGALAASIALRTERTAPQSASSVAPSRAQRQAPMRLGDVEVLRPAPASITSAPPAPAPAPALFAPLSSSTPAARVRALGKPQPVVASEPASALTAGDDEARVLRSRCEHGLLTARDRATVDACRAFAQRFPSDPAVRVLAYAAGRVAEDELDDPAVAEQEYERALLLSPVSGAPATDALWARARVRAKQGELDEARADLRLYIAQVPSARHDEAVVALARTLGLVP
jgi:tetratricopeptide (TPR) repeat protein